jgi:hypothetical protein
MRVLVECPRGPVTSSDVEVVEPGGVGDRFSVSLTGSSLITVNTFDAAR